MYFPSWYDLVETKLTDWNRYIDLPDIPHITIDPFRLNIDALDLQIYLNTLAYDGLVTDVEAARK